jgi:hypothetical protein
MNRLTQKKVLSMFTPLTMWQQKQRTTSQLSFGRIIGRIVVMMMVLVLIQISTASIQAQNQPVFRIGVLGEEDSDFVHGIQLALIQSMQMVELSVLMVQPSNLNWSYNLLKR